MHKNGIITTIAKIASNLDFYDGIRVSMLSTQLHNAALHVKSGIYVKLNRRLFNLILVYCSWFFEKIEVHNFKKHLTVFYSFKVAKCGTR